MLDGIKLERAGIPAVAIITTPFIATAQAMAKIWGTPSYEFVVTSHPIANLNETELNAKADELTDQIIRFLTGGESVPT